MNGYTKNVKSAQITGKDKIQLNQVDISEPTGKQVLLKIISAGVCHSDVHLRDGGVDLGGTFFDVTNIGVKYPYTPGHEIVGTIEKIGESVQNVKIGDTVLVYTWLGCGECPTCKNGEQNLCEISNWLGVFQNGGYAEQIIVPDSKFLINIGDLNPDSAAPLGCAGLTAYATMKKALLNSPENILIIGGGGGLGLLAVQLAKYLSKCNIICADIDDEKLKTAKELGADHVVNINDNDVSQKIRSITNEKGVECIVDLVGLSQTFQFSQSIIRKRGNIIQVGLHGGIANAPLPFFPLLCLTITYVLTGTFDDLIELVNLAKKGVVKPIISKHYSLDEASLALDDLKNGKILGRAVINP